MEDMGETVGGFLEGVDTITIEEEETIEQPDEARGLAVVAVEVEEATVVEGVDS